MAPPKKHSPVYELAREVDRLRDEEATARAACEEVDTAAEQLAGIERTLVGLTEQKRKCEERIEEYQKGAERVRALRAEADALQANSERSEGDHNNAVKELERYREAEEIAKKAGEKLEGIQRRLDEQATSVKAARALMDEAAEELRTAQERRKQASSDCEQARTINRALELRNKCAGLLEQIAGLSRSSLTSER